ncbi:hypothetical protein BN2537_2467 [Streptomyces venezuelae]|nr:hypothetical protein BN2537_2467 [Streptomyces venezuelae]
MVLPQLGHDPNGQVRSQRAECIAGGWTHQLPADSDGHGLKIRAHPDSVMTFSDKRPYLN